MGVKPLSTRTSLGAIEDLTTPSSTQAYPLGLEVVIEDSATKTVKKYIYVKSHAALTAYVPYALDFTGTDAAEVATKTPVAIAANGALIVVPSVAFTSGYYGFCQFFGHATVKHAGATTATHAVCVKANAATVVTTEASATITVNTCGLAVATGSASGSNTFLLGNQAIVQAS